MAFPINENIIILIVIVILTIIFFLLIYSFMFGSYLLRSRSNINSVPTRAQAQQASQPLAQARVSSGSLSGLTEARLVSPILTEARPVSPRSKTKSRQRSRTRRRSKSNK